MKYKIILGTFLIFFTVLYSAFSQTRSENGARFELTVRQKPAGIDQYFEIIKKSVDVTNGKSITTFIVNMNLELQINSIDSQFVSFDMHLTTIGKSIYNDSRRFRIEYNLPARIENIPGKNGSVYQLLISPREIIEVDTTCYYDLSQDITFQTNPSANFDINFVQYSLGDYQWTNVKSYLEYDYVRFRRAFEINTPGKINVFLFPCASDNIDWDNRFGYAIEPGKGNIHSIYNSNYNSLDAILPNLLMLYRLWGYAPPLIVEGLAGYFEFSRYEMKKIKKRQNLVPLKKLVTSESYYSADPITAEITASSFMKFLADSYGISKIKNLYEQSDDLNLLKNIEGIFEKSLDSLEKEWLDYVDTTAIRRMEFNLHATRAGVMFRSDLQIEYLTEMTKYDASRFDSVETWNNLSTVLYQYGHYYDAIKGYKLLMKLNGPKTLYKQILGNLYMINGKYDDAFNIFDTVFIEDTTMAASKLLQAKIRAIRGDTARAITTAEDYYLYEQSRPGKVEFLLFLGEMYGTPGTHYDSVKANDNFADAFAWSIKMIPQAPLDPAPKLRAGRALLGLKRYNEAGQYLELAHFTEQRAYYRGRALLYLGKLHDAMDEHDKAIIYYQHAIEIQLADFDREECIKYIDKPYRH